MTPFSCFKPSRSTVTNVPPGVGPDLPPSTDSVGISGSHAIGMPPDRASTPPCTAGTRTTNAKWALGILAGTAAAAGVTYAVARTWSQGTNPQDAPHPAAQTHFGFPVYPADLWGESREASELCSLVTDAAARCIHLFFPGTDPVANSWLAEDASAPTTLSVGRELFDRGVNMSRLTQQPLDGCPSSLLPGESPFDLAMRTSFGLADQLRGMATRLQAVPGCRDAPSPAPLTGSAASALADSMGVIALAMALNALQLLH